MEGKLIKMMEGYIISLTGNIDDIYAITNKELAEEHGFYFISLKNCQAIELGYDLDELAVLSTKEETTIVGNQKMAQGFIKGFQKCLEILGDKKFSEDDMKEAYSRGFLQQGIKSFNSLIQSLQQTEWDVEIVMDSWFKNGHDGKIVDTNPKLDADGCLILRKI